MSTPQDLYCISSSRLPSLRNLVYRDYGEEVRAAAEHAAGNSSSPDSYILEWNNALSAKVNSLLAEERKKYDDEIAAEVIRRQSRPSKDEILSSQHMLREEITTTVRNILGWERKQYGDAMCFLTITYRNRDEEIIEESFMVSNEERFLTHYKSFLARYDEYMGGHFASIGELALPKHGLNTLPKSSFIKDLVNGVQVFSPPDPEVLKPSELRQLLKMFIEEIWANSDAGRTPATVPWHLLEATEQEASPLQDFSILSKFPNLNPEKLGFSDLFKLAQVLSSADHGVIFKKAALQIPLDGSTPPPLQQPGTPLMSPINVSPEPPQTPHQPPQEQTHSTTPQRPPNITPIPQPPSSVDRPPPTTPKTTEDTVTTQQREEQDLSPFSVQLRLSVPAPALAPAQSEPKTMLQPPTESAVAPVPTSEGSKKGKKQRNQVRVSRAGQPSRSSSRVSKPPTTIEPLRSTGAKKTRVSDRYTYEEVDPNREPEPTSQSVDKSKNGPVPSAQEERPRKKPRKK